MTGVRFCKDCRFWNRNGDPFERPSREGDDPALRDHYIPVPTNKQKCFRVLHANGEEEYDGLAIVTDGSGYSAILWTEPTFGCALFEIVEDSAQEGEQVK
jgi:hypothetical protein